MKILMVNKFLYPNGGSETYIFELGKCLEGMGHEVQYFGMEHEGRIVGNKLELYTDNMDFHAKASCGRGLFNKLTKLKYPFKIIYSGEAASKITRILQDFKPDVVHFNNINFQLTPSVIEAVADYDIRNHKDTRIIATAHDYQWVCPNHMLKKPANGQLCFECEGGAFGNCIRNKCIHSSTARSVLGTIEAYFYRHRKTYGLVDTVICPSEFIKNKLETNPELTGKCHVMHNFMVDTAKNKGTFTNAGTDTKSDNPISAAQTQQAKPKQDAGDISGQQDKFVLYFGRFSKEKGIETLLKVCRSLPDIPFVFAGNGELKSQVDEVPNIENLGFLNSEAMHNMIQRARFVVFPSEWYENCPFSVMEAQQFGTPIIASDMGGTPELVENGVTGELFQAGNEEELAGKIRRLWEDDELIGRYKEACSKVTFDTVEEYCGKLIKIYG